MYKSVRIKKIKDFPFSLNLEKLFQRSNKTLQKEKERNKVEEYLVSVTTSCFCYIVFLLTYCTKNWLTFNKISF